MLEIRGVSHVTFFISYNIFIYTMRYLGDGSKNLRTSMFYTLINIA